MLNTCYHSLLKKYTSLNVADADIINSVLHQQKSFLQT